MQSAQSWPSRHSPARAPDQKLTAGLYTTHAHNYDCIIKEGGASYTRGSWIVHSHYRGTVEILALKLIASYNCHEL